MSIIDGLSTSGQQNAPYSNALIIRGRNDVLARRVPCYGPHPIVVPHKGVDALLRLQVPQLDRLVTTTRAKITQMLGCLPLRLGCLHIASASTQRASCTQRFDDRQSPCFGGEGHCLDHVRVITQSRDTFAIIDTPDTNSLIIGATCQALPI